MPRNTQRFRLWSIALCMSLATSVWVTPETWPVAFAARPSVAPRAVLSIAASWSDDAAVKVAAADLAKLWQQAFRAPLSVGGSRDAARGGSDALIVRLQPTTALADAETQERLASRGEEAFLLRAGAPNGDADVEIVANTALGAAYGLFRYGELARIDPANRIRPPEVLGAPGMNFRLLADPLDPTYPEPEEALRLGFNAIMVDPWPSLALYDGFDRSVYDPSRFPEERAWVQERRKRTAARIARAKALHLSTVSAGDVPSLPKQALAQYGELVGPGTFCVDRPMTARLVAASLQEVISAFPQIDIYMTRTGENYPLGPLSGTAPADRSGACGRQSGVDQAVALVYDVVVSQHHLTYVHRAWDLGDDGVHSSPARAAALVRALPGDQLGLSFKHTQTDFWRFNPLNPNLLLGDQRMIEFQAAREYEGKGAYPNFLAEVFATGGPEVARPGGIRAAANAGVKSVWVWGKGGGWGGPVPHSSLWNDANVYALSRLAWNPWEEPDQLAYDFAALRFGPAAAAPMARVLIKSAEANLLALYVGPAARARGPWAPNNLLIRDDVIRGGSTLTELYRASRAPGAFERAINEKQLALRVLDGMIADFEEAEPAIADRALAGEVRDTLLYHRSLVSVIASYLDGMFYYFKWVEGSRRDAIQRDRALDRLLAWKESWTEHRDLAATLPNAASPYRSEGMEETAETALADLLSASRR